MTANEVREALKAYMEIRNACLLSSDLLYIGSNGKPVKNPSEAVSTHVKKSGWRKVGVAYNLSWTVDDPVLENSEDRFGKYFIFKSRATVVAPCGRYTSALGVCSSRNPFFSKAHGLDIQPNPEDIAMMSQTVAVNRAISDMVGGGEVTAEEIMGKTVREETAEKQRAQSEPAKKQLREKKPPAPASPIQPPATLPEPAKEEDVLALLEWFTRAREAGMTDEAYNNMLGHFAPGCSYNELATIEEWLVKHYPDQKPEKP